MKQRQVANLPFFMALTAFMRTASGFAVLEMLTMAR
jgi:hypothetical protein